MAATQAGDLKQAFARRFGQSSRIYQAPGRVNLIGEHTDYNGGFVMPAAIGFRTLVGVAPRSDRKIVVYSENYSEEVTFDLDRLPTKPEGHWSDYVAGVAKILEQSDRKLSGVNLLLDGDVPQGAGLSSSASLEVAVGYVLLTSSGFTVDAGENSSDKVGKTQTSDLRVDKTMLALLCQRAENEFVGARCGIMDQFVSSHGSRGKALMLDCRSLQYRLLPLPGDISLAICNTMVKHSIAKGEYNRRREECEEGVRGLSARLPKVQTLRDVTMEDLAKLGGDLPEVVRRRCRHVISENARVLDAAQALERGDLSKFGSLMAASHRSLRDDFEVSSAELDLMVDLASRAPGVYGARMTGGGFGGCAVALVETTAVDSFQRRVQDEYEAAMGYRPEVYICSAADGVGEVDAD